MSTRSKIMKKLLNMFRKEPDSNMTLRTSRLSSSEPDLLIDRPSELQDQILFALSRDLDNNCLQYQSCQDLTEVGKRDPLGPRDSAANYFTPRATIKKVDFITPKHSISETPINMVSNVVPFFKTPQSEPDTTQKHHHSNLIGYMTGRGHRIAAGDADSKPRRQAFTESKSQSHFKQSREILDALDAAKLKLKAMSEDMKNPPLLASNRNIAASLSSLNDPNRVQFSLSQTPPQTSGLASGLTSGVTANSAPPISHPHGHGLSPILHNLTKE
ncbi:hypothetical protein WR25_26177 [Diploscapter pachys]|uniref:Uncharacterized protein n=1 Tax=Diploscapter pachys TaxID=2018661 RepID=A0A2A2J6B7_9BILA|nr:hypothetical protein WR25_26177 [Diploscapter pachys]